MRDRARIVLLAADGLATRAIGRIVGWTTGTASKWRVRYARARLAGLDETGNRVLRRNPPCRAKTHPRPFGSVAASRLRELDRAVAGANAGRYHENTFALPARPEDRPLGPQVLCESSDPEFVAKAAEIVGLYMAALENAVVLSVDGKPSIQALERAQGYPKFPDGRAMTGQSHDYKRHGTTTLFAALEIATGQITGRHYKRRRRVEFLDFMNRLVADYPDREIHVILDNLSTHKPKRDLWLARHPNVHAHYTPTHASWLNQIEIWFSILGGNSLAGASFHTVDERKAISTASSPATTTTPDRSPGQRAKSTRSASSRVSSINDFGYEATSLPVHSQKGLSPPGR